MLVAMEQKGLRTGHFVALAGAVLAVVSLFRPWYAVEIPQEVRDVFRSQAGSDPGLFGELARGLASRLPSEISASGFKELEGADVVVVVAAVGVVALVLAAAGAISGLRADPGAAGGLAGVLGAAIAVVALAHLVNKPGDGPASEWVHVSEGLWLALAGGALTAFGGLWAAADAGTARRRPAAAPRRAASGSGSGLNDAFPPLTPDLPPVFAEPAASSSIAPPPRA